MTHLFTVFVSGTRRDLASFYPAAKTALETALAGAVVRMMEESSPDGGFADEWSRRQATSASVLVGLIGQCYGYVPPGQRHSLTEQEFETAGSAGVDCLMFLTDASAPELVRQQTATQRQQIARFRRRVSRLFRGTVQEPDEFADQVVRAVREWAQRTFCGTTQTPVEYFRPWLRPELLVGHHDPLVGHHGALSELLAFPDSRARILILHAPWGQGKSRLLYEFASRRRDHVRFVRFGARVSREALQLSATDPCVIVIEDVQSWRGPELQPLFEFLQRAAPSVKLMVTTRGDRLSEFRDVAAAAAIPAAEIHGIALAPLTPVEHQALVVQTLGHDGPDAAHLIARTRGVPLAAVVGARLLKRGLVTMSQLEAGKDFVEEVLDRYFRAVLLSAHLSPERSRGLERVLEAVALAGPVRPASEIERNTVAAFLGCGPAELVTDLEFLEGQGLLLRLGGLLAVPVDAVRESMVLRACVTDQGTPTGEAERAFRELGGTFQGNLLASLAAAEWHAKVQGRGVRLLDAFMGSLVERYQSGGSSERQGLLEDLKTVAPSRPREIVAFVGQLLAGLLRDHRQIALSEADSLSEMVFRAVLEERAVVEEGCDLLWLLAEEEARPPNSHPESAERHLREVGQYCFVGGFGEAFVRWAERQAKDGPIPGARLAHYVGPLLDKVIEQRWSDGLRFSLRPVPIDPTFAQPLRARSLEILETLAKSDDLPTMAAGIRCLRACLAPPQLFARQPPAQLLAGWEPEQLETIERLRRIYWHHRTPAAAMVVLETISWSARYSKQAAIRAAAHLLDREIRPQLRESLPLALSSPHGALWQLNESSLARHWRLAHRVAKALLRTIQDPRVAWERVAETLAVLQRADLASSPGPLVHGLCAIRPEVAERSAEIARQDPEHLLALELGTAIGALLEVDPPRGASLLEQVLGWADPALLQQLAVAYRNPVWFKTVEPLRADRHLQRFLGHPDAAVRSAALATLWIAGELPAVRRLKHVLDYDPAVHPETGEEWAHAAYHGSLLDLTTARQRKILVQRCLSIPSIGYFGQRLVEHLTASAPTQVVDGFLARVRGAGTHPFDHRVVPRPDREDCFEQVPPRARRRGLVGLAELLVAEDASVRIAAQELFAALARSGKSTARRVRACWVASGDPCLIRAAARSFGHQSELELASEEGAVVAILRAAEESGPRVLRSVQSTLLSVSSLGLRWGTTHEEAVRDQCRAIAGRYQADSLEAVFYLTVAARAENMLARAKQREAELLLSHG